MTPLKIFIVEDDLWYAELLRKHLSLNPDYEIEIFNKGKDCLNNLYKMPSIVTIDYSLPDMNGKELMTRIRDKFPGIFTLIISGQNDINTAVELLKEGAYDYIVKNDEAANRLWNSIRLIKENISLKRENEQLKKEVIKKYDFSKIIVGESKQIKDVFNLIEKAVESTITVSITGETGSGKELIAKAIHYNSNRSGYPFIAINLGAIPKDLVESELFGYEKGAFTGAYTRKAGIFEEAHHGTIFLDEIAEMDLNIQSKFLRVLQEKEVRRLGGSQHVKVDVRIITATHKNLAEEVKKGNFRADLYYRVMGLPIHIPPLRERGSDIMLLANFFAGEFCKENQREKVIFTPDAVRKMLSYSFPGNVRELKAAVELAIIMSEEDRVDANHLNFYPAELIPAIVDEALSLQQRILLIVKESLLKNENNPTKVARNLGISRATVYRYIKELETKQ
jgi:DNA-binding NtrC family response regulator